MKEQFRDQYIRLAITTASKNRGEQRVYQIIYVGGQESQISVALHGKRH